MDGKLSAAIYAYPVRSMVWAISTGDTEYAIFLEYGTSRIEPRPYMQPMAFWLEQNMKDFIVRWFDL